MASVDHLTMPSDAVALGPEAKEAPPPEDTDAGQEPRWHRIRTVRLQQGMSLRSVARHSGVEVRQLRIQEQESADLRLSDLHKWRKALDTPLSELLVEPESSLSCPIMERARLIRLMKTATAIRDQAESVETKRMAQMLTEQLTEIMPELANVNPWHEYGQPRSSDEYGRIVERTIADDVFHNPPCD
ncbi:MAG: helix-turn-helix domain-containing protein [Planctomycetota bacterium]